MRVAYIYPSASEFDIIFKNEDNFIKGGGLSDIKTYHQRGGSLFGILGRLLRNSIPFIKRIILPEVGTLAQNVTRDVSNGVPLRDTLKQSLKRSAINVGKRVVTGRGGKKRLIKRKIKKQRKIKCPSIKNDIFSNGKYEL